MRIAKRDALNWKTAWTIRAGAIIAGLLISGIFTLIITGISPLSIYSDMFAGTFGTAKRIIKTVKNMTPLLCLAIGLAPAFKMRFWNIGAQGQMLVGALAASSCAVYMRDLTPALLIPMAVIAGIAAGALWGLIPAVFKAFWNTNETLFTLMLNYIATFWVMVMLDKWKGVNSAFGQLTENVWLPRIFGEYFTLFSAFVILLAIGMYLYMRYSKQGYEIAVVGESENTARYAGINVKKVVIRTMLISGGICGVCGAFTAIGINRSLAETMNSGYGFTAIVVAWLAKFNPFYMFMSAFMMIFFDNAAAQISSNNANASQYFSSILSGIILFSILASEFFINYRVILPKRVKRKDDVQTNGGVE